LLPRQDGGRGVEEGLGGVVGKRDGAVAGADEDRLGERLQDGGVEVDVHHGVHAASLQGSNRSGRRRRTARGSSSVITGRRTALAVLPMASRYQPICFRATRTPSSVPYSERMSW